ncbi:MAG TPA: hypothetical protein VGO53_14160, partial [Steroidobacteraceae bacterium]|nr:hypothetical protein [Steroidobacteraceae bacterium]
MASKHRSRPKKSAASGKSRVAKKAARPAASRSAPARSVTRRRSPARATSSRSAPPKAAATRTSRPATPKGRKLRELYPSIKPYNSGHLRVSDVHEIYFEECGNPRGKPAVFLHGG